MTPQPPDEVRVGPPLALASAITYDQTSFEVVGDASDWPESDFQIKIEDELILVGTRSGNTLSDLTRGHEGTDDTHHNNHVEVAYVKTGTEIATGDVSGSDLPDPTDEGDVLTVVDGEWAGAASAGTPGPKGDKGDPGETNGLHWFHVRDITWDELQGDLSTIEIDICTLRTGTWLQDITFIPSLDFDDAEAGSGGIQYVGWGDYAGANIGDGSNSGFEFTFPSPKDVHGSPTQHWWNVSQEYGGLYFGHGPTPEFAVTNGMQTGVPVHIRDEDVAGPLKCGTGGMSGDSTQGHIEVWILIQGTDPDTNLVS